MAVAEGVFAAREVLVEAPLRVVSGRGGALETEGVVEVAGVAGAPVVEDGAAEAVSEATGVGAGSAVGVGSGVSSALGSAVASEAGTAF